MVDSMKEIIEVENCIRKFSWVIQMVKSRLFHKVCDQHIKRQQCHFCCDCMIPPLCEICLKKSDHKDHLTVQAFKCSNKSGVRTKTISKYMDVSGIHTYVINLETIVFINQRRENDNHRFKNNVSHKCRVCEWALDAASALFHSIECKLRNVLGSQLDEMMESSEDVIEIEPVVKRKHRRKGIPYRSPFY